MSEPYNLDDGVSEYFEFILKEHRYRFRQPTLREIMDFQKLNTEDQEKANEFVLGFVTKVEKSTPEFKDVFEKIDIPRYKKFMEMLKTEFSK